MTINIGSYNEGATPSINWGQDITIFGNVRYSHGIADCGTSGVATAQISFEIPNTAVPSPVQTGAPVKISSSGKIFWVNQRSVGLCTTSFTCLDSVALLDVTLDVSDGHYYQDLTTKEKYIEASEIVAQVGTAGRALTLTSLYDPTGHGFPITAVEGKTLIQILTEASEMMCGFFATDNSNNLNFYSASAAPPSVGTAVTYHSYVDIGGTFAYKNVLLVGKTDPIHGTGTGIDFVPAPDTLYPYTTNPLNYTLLEVNGALAQYAIINNSGIPRDFDGLINKVFTQWNVENALISTIPELSSYFGFRQFYNPSTGEYSQLMRMTDCEIRWVGDQMIASLGGGIPQTGELARRSRRQMETDSKLEEGKTYGPFMFTRYQGNIRLQESASSSS